jgi:hypothetical protein
MMGTQTRSSLFIRKYGALLLPLGLLGVSLVWMIVWWLAALGALSLHWMYQHLDSATSLVVAKAFTLSALGVTIILLVRALLRPKAAFRWRALFLSVIIGGFILVTTSLSEYDSIQTLASASFDGHTYQWLEFKDFFDPHYTLLECDPAVVVCRATYIYKLDRVCDLSDPHSQTVQRLIQSEPKSTTLSVDATARTIIAQINGQPFFTYDLTAQQSVGPCEQFAHKP